MKTSILHAISRLVALTTILAIGLAGPIAHSHADTPPGWITLPDNVALRLANARLLSSLPLNPNTQMTIELVLAMNHPERARAFIDALHDPHSSSYHHWLATGGFNAFFGPTTAQVQAAKYFLVSSGLTVLPQAPGNSAFLIVARGSVHNVEAAFHVSIRYYQGAGGNVFFSNNTDPQIPASLQGIVIGILGLNNAPAAYPRSVKTRPASRRSSQVADYGGGPNGSGLTPSQIASIYNADPVYRKLHDWGQRTTLGLFQLSGYTPSDITVYENTFHLRHVPLVNILVDGGATDHSGAVEVALDIEMQIALAQGAKRILVYQSPNDDKSIVNQYFRIATDNLADAISTSWGLCEPLSNPSEIRAENIAFIQMASQGQSIFAASGDDGAFDCKQQGDPTLLAVDNPASQPYMAGVGGTSFAGTFDPGNNPHPGYPPLPAEHAWDGSGGGVSQIWASPAYQRGPGVFEPGFSRTGAYCGQPAGVLCRQVPDVSMNADPDSPYSMYCTDPGDNRCTGFMDGDGTSASAPLWSAIAALADTFQKGRLGLFNFFIYHLNSPFGYHRVFHDITVGNNGHYPAGPAYDMVTGIGSPDIFGLVTLFGKPQHEQCQKHDKHCKR
ncbi:S53 family peptidase [Dictyobacter aurantiacus]|uniref:Pseudomonapepsin n=1 Tax=Dictyobacter aurantiacus TaxID=1936993 RepID=A0A401ZMQ9_9CHLR|nr:S53 family peptidase [Dictyobacter aurantiacus]GCE08100.1 pseudomonapepsin [Dictyobacter aurantiacus]